MKRLNVLFKLLLIISLGITAYYTHRVWTWSFKAVRAFEYYEAATECLLQQDGQAESDIDILFKGYKSREAYRKQAIKEWPELAKDKEFMPKRLAYNDQIPQCKKFYSEYRCWELDPHSPASLDGCGKRFGLLQAEIDTMKKDPKTISAVMDAYCKRRTEEAKKVRNKKDLR